MKKTNLTLSLAVGVIIGATLIFQNCSQVAFSSMDNASLSFPIFPTPPGGGGGGGSNPGSVPLQFDCSDKGYAEVGYDLESVSGIAIIFYQKSGGGSSATLTELPYSGENYAQLRAYVLSSKAIPIPTNLGAGTYAPLICPIDSSGNVPASCSLSLSGGSLTIGESDLAPNVKFGGSSPYTFTVSSSGSVSSNGSLGVLLDSASANNPNCDQTASPLMIHLADAGLGVTLSAPAEGVNFDILNDGSLPRISWPQNPAVDVFLALPTADGKILGAQQLFGNNTVGPDGKKAANGFRALAKLAPGARYIDASTPIYNELRLWADTNRNGVVDAGELFTLAEKHITKIDLKYQDVYEVDQYGNETRERSTVFETGSLRLIFDVWFNLE